MYALGNVEEAERADPGFRIPPVVLRESLEPGDLAEIMVLSERLTEPAWVEVVDVLGPGIYSGIFESGEPVEFSAEHVADFAPGNAAAPRMGESKPKPTPFEVLRRPPAPRPPDPFEVLRRKPARPPSPFEVLRRPPVSRAAEPPPTPPPQPAAPSGPKRGFFERFNIFRRKPRYDVEPVPAAERREPVRPRGPLPGLPAPMDMPAYGPPPAPASPVIPPAPTMLMPQEERGTQEAPPRGALIMPEYRPAAILAPDAFSILVPPSEPAAPGGLTVPFGPSLPSSGVPDAFTMLAPPPGSLMPAAPTSAFDLLVPLQPAAAGLAPFEAQPGGMSVFDVLAPEPGPLAPYDPHAQDPFTIVAPPGRESPFLGPLVPGTESARQKDLWPEDLTWGGSTTPQPPQPEVPERKGKQQRKFDRVSSPGWTRKGRGRGWIMPDPRDIVPWIENAFATDKLWDMIRADREDEYFREAVISQEDMGEPAIIPFETIAYPGQGSWIAEVSEFFEFPEEVMLPYIDAIEKAEELEEDPSSEEEEASEFLRGYYDRVNAAFNLIKPRDIPGEIIVEYYEDQIVLAYWEGLSEEEKRRLAREQQFIQEENERQAAERKKALRRIWGKMPTVEELVPFIEEKFDIDAIWKEVRKTRKTKGFRDTFDDQGDAMIELEKVASEGPSFYEELAYYFSLPPALFALYLDQKEPLEGLLWNEVLGEFLNRISQAFDETKPRDIPGMIVVSEEEGQDRYLTYVEQFE